MPSTIQSRSPTPRHPLRAEPSPQLEDGPAGVRAREQVAQWEDTGDPGAWDARVVLRDLAADSAGRA